MKIRPTRDNVTIELIKSSKVTESGIVIQGASEVDRARVLAIGPAVNDDEVQPNDLILVNWNKVTKAGQDFIIPVTEIIGVILED